MIAIHGYSIAQHSVLKNTLRSQCDPLYPRGQEQVMSSRVVIEHYSPLLQRFVTQYGSRKNISLMYMCKN